MNYQIKWYLIIYLFFFQMLSAKAQGYKYGPSGGDMMYDNAIYASFGLLGYFGTATLNYEHILKQNMWNRPISSYLKVGVGGFDAWDGGGKCLLAQVGMLTGYNKSHFEASLGIMTLKDSDGYSFFLINPVPSIHIGYRFQKPDGQFVFRTGIGFPEGLCISLGLSF